MVAQQIVLDFEGGLTERFPDWRDVVRASVYDCGRPFKAIAADLDMSASLLSRRLSGAEDAQHFPLDRLPELLAATGDMRPIHWLAERFLTDARLRDAQVRARLAHLLPEMERLVSQLNGGAR